jgi:hypothetical protein
VVERIRRRHAERKSICTSLGSNPGPRNYDFFPFPPLFSFFCHIQTFFYTSMNIFITLLENVNKSRTSANNLCWILNHIKRSEVLCSSSYTYLKYTWRRGLAASKLFLTVHSVLSGNRKHCSLVREPKIAFAYKHRTYCQTANCLMVIVYGRCCVRMIWVELSQAKPKIDGFVELENRKSEADD